MTTLLLVLGFALLPTTGRAVARQPYFHFPQAPQVQELNLSALHRSAAGSGKESNGEDAGGGNVSLLHVNATHVRVGNAVPSAEMDRAAHQGSSWRINIAWFIGGAVVLVVIPCLIMAGCMSLSNQMSSTTCGLVAAAFAVVFGRLTGRPSATRQAPHSPMRTPESSSNDIHGAAQRADATQYRQWQDSTNIAEEKRVHFQKGDTSFETQSSSSTTTLFAASSATRSVPITPDGRGSPHFGGSQPTGRAAA